MRIVNRSVQRCTTTLLYGSTFVQYFRTSGSTKVLSYFRTTYVTTYCKLRRYEGNSLRRYESTKVLSKVQTYFRKYFRNKRSYSSCTLVQSEINYNYSSCTVSCLEYLRTKVLSYCKLLVCEGTKVRKYESTTTTTFVRKYESSHFRK